MAEDEETAQEEAAPETEEKPARGRRGRKVDPPVSLHPLSFEEAVWGLLQVKVESDSKDAKSPNEK